MTFKGLKEAVERNIIKLFQKFYENPAVFLCETDVESYLYSLLINDSFLKQFSPHFKDDFLKKDSRTVLIHTEIPLEIRRRKIGIYDISIWKPKKVVKWDEWETTIGIEIKFNRAYPRIIEDVHKVKQDQRGYVLWLNWDRPIGKKTLKKAEDLVKRYRNVRLFYLDVFSDPIKTNVRQVKKLVKNSNKL